MDTETDTASTSGKATGLNPRRGRFAAEYAVDGNGAQAAIRAGYSPNSAKVTASRLLTDPNVASAIDTAQAATLERLEITADDIARVAWELATDAKVAPAARVSALALLAKRHMEFSEKREMIDAEDAIRDQAREMGLDGDDAVEKVKARLADSKVTAFRAKKA